MGGPPGGRWEGKLSGAKDYQPLCSAVGPCALEYTKMKTADHFWTDPSADELVQRHRIHSSHLRQDSPTKRPALCVSGVGSETLWGNQAEFLTGHGGRGWSGALKVTPASSSTSAHTARSRRGFRVAAWMTAHPSPPATTWSPCTRTPGPPCCMARTTFLFSR